MIESYKQAIEEYKRVDHLFFVTLKYTRTADVIRSMLERLVTTYEYALECVLKVFKEEKKIEEIPKNPVGRAELVKEKSNNIEISGYIDDYLKIRKILRQPYTKKEEYRRHVTMTVELDEEKIHTDIDRLKEYYDDTGKLLSYVKVIVEGYK